MKKCSKCGEIKELSKFGKHIQGKDGLRCQCKKCHAENNKQHYKKNKKLISAKRKAKYKTNKNAVTKQQKQYKKQTRACEKSGTYRLICVPTGETYYGSSAMLNTRKLTHLCCIKNKTHSNPNIRKLSETYGPDDWEFEILCYCDDAEQRLRYELSLIKALSCLNKHTHC